MLRKIMTLTCQERVITKLTPKRLAIIPSSKYFTTNTNESSSDSSNSTNNPVVNESAEEEEEEEEVFPVDREKKLSKLLDESASFNELGNSSWSTPPYPETAIPQSGKVKVKPEIDAQTTAILLFPGQGTLKVGAVKKYLGLSRVRETFAIAKEILGYDILDICLNGPQEKLNRTEFNQVATVLTSLSALEKMWEERPATIERCKAAAGYSVGELTALVFSGALTVEDGIRLAGIRGAAMQIASDMVPQGMLTLISRPASQRVPKICREAADWALNLGIADPVCKTAIYLYTETKILAGHKEALDFIENNTERFKIMKAVRLPVSGAFHTPLMKPAMFTMTKAMKNMEIEDPRLHVYSNITTKPYRSAMDIRQMLPKQMTKPVRWEQLVASIFERPQGRDFPQTFDLGSNGTMKTILTRINAQAARSCYTF